MEARSIKGGYALEGCVAKTGAAGGRVRGRVCALSSPYPSPTPLSGGTMRGCLESIESNFYVF